MHKRKILFICEGSSDEPKFLKLMMRKVFPQHKYEIYSYNTTIHTLAAKLKKDYPDFDSGDTEIALILRDMETDEDKRNLLSGFFSDIILAFDFDAQHDNPDFGMVKRMLSYYTESSDMGKLYINYPMMQSYRHLKRFPDQDFTTRTASPIGYKELVSNQSELGDLSKYGYDTYIKIAIQHLIKVWYIITGENKIPTKEEYLSINWNTVYDKEMDLYSQYKNVFVLNTLILSIIDYNPTTFFNQINKHPEKFQY